MWLFLTVLCSQIIFVYCWAKSSVSLHSCTCMLDNACRSSRLGMTGTDSSLSILTSDTSTKFVKVLGVCGGIGSGKSTACKVMVSDLNCLAHIDSDSIAHSVYEANSPVIYDVVKEFGSDILIDGEIDRKKLGSIVFADNDAMKRLERIVWPHVRTKILQQIDIIKSAQSVDNVGKVPIIVVEAAVILDAEWMDFLDAVWVVTASQQVASYRLQNNRGLNMEEATKRIDAQISRRGIGNLQEEVDAGILSAVILNDGTLEDLKALLSKKLYDPNAWYQRK
jgi:dephospho-CoA kinase